MAVAAVAERLMGGGGGARRWQVPAERASERRNWRRVPLGCRASGYVELEREEREKVSTRYRKPADFASS